MRVTLRFTTGFGTTHSFKKVIVIPFIPQVGMTLVVGDCPHKVKDVIWYESNGAIEVIVDEPLLNRVNNGWEQIE